MKSEPSAYSIDDLKREGRTDWDGVRNYQARNFMCDEMSPGDAVLFYHSNAGVDTGVVGEMRVVGPAIVDGTQFDSHSKYYDPTSTKDSPRWWCRRLAFVSKFARTVALEEIKQLPVFKDSMLTRKGNRLSVIPLTKSQYERVITLSKK
jgi:predicted RNA-binding protein with PUA-like domain